MVFHYFTMALAYGSSLKQTIFIYPINNFDFINFSLSLLFTVIKLL